ncbi:hypothetical protein AB832_05205, partial [Flavobacteriaceae bacterium (ex Bugula neritina AB1)]
MIKKILFILVCVTSLNLIYGQDTSINSQVLPDEIPLHNSIRYNRFMFNPTFSFVRENKNSINIYNRNERVSFLDNPQTYVLNYNGKFDDKMGLGVGLYQQNIGVLRYFGGTLNYAYNIELNRDMNFTFGMNAQYSQTSLKSKLDEAQLTNPITDNFEASSILLLHPGVNLSYEGFDVGASVRNLVAYNITGSELITDKFEYSGHVMYTTELDWRTDNEVRGMAYASKPGELDLRYGGNVLFAIPKYGWAQLGYNSFFGGSIGVGANITKLVSVSYTVEPGIGGEANTAEFGATHEFGLAFNFAEQKSRRKRRGISNPAYEARDSEIRRLKKEIIEQARLIRELRNSRGDSLSQAQRKMSRLERSIREAKEKEARAAKKSELQRIEDVKLLNDQREEEERLRAKSRLALEMAEKKKEEERLAAESKLAREMAEQKRLAEEEAAGLQAEEARIAAEEAAREAEAEKQEEEARKEEERLAAQKRLEVEMAAKKVEEEKLAAQKKLELEMAEQKAEEERLASQKRLERELAEQKAEEERIASQKKLEREVALQKAEEERIASQKKLEREIVLQKDKEAEEARLAAEAEAARLAE